MKRVLIIDNQQFGYLTDTYKYCEHLKDRYDITYLCYDKGLPKIDLDGIHIVYVKRWGNKLLRGIYFYLRVLMKMLLFHGFIFIVYFQSFEYIKKILPWKKMHLDVRTMSVHPDKNQRDKKDKGIKKAAKWYDSVSYISDGVGKMLELSEDKRKYLLPLGADIISHNEKVFDCLRLLYVGTLNNRNILKTVKGLELFIQKHPLVSIHYDIVGDGKEYDEISEYISAHELKDIVMHGRVDYKHLKPFFDDCNIGVSFVPKTSYYDIQPPTKTFEYAFSGLFTIATSTLSNQEIVRPCNGILIEDNAESFADGLEKIMKMKESFKSSDIRTSLLEYSWQNIIDTYLVEIIEKEYPVKEQNV